MTPESECLSWNATWHGKKATVILSQSGNVLFADKCDPGSAEARNRMFNRMNERLPAVDRGPIEARLMAMAREPPPDSVREETGFALPANPPAWSSPVQGDLLMDEIVALLRRYVVLPEHAATAVALWVVHTYVVENFMYSPRLLVSSPEKRCGKSLLLRFVAALVVRPLPCENISTAALYRSIEKFAPTLILDEADTYLAGRNANEEMRGIINAGFTRGGCVVRCVGDELEPIGFNVFGAMALGMIGKPQGTIEDRSIAVLMRRKMPGESVQRLPPGRPLRDLVTDIVRRIVRWTADHGSDLSTAAPQVPAELDDRARDSWFALLAIADAAGGSWPEQARLAAVALSLGRDAPGSLALVLLADLREIFQERQAVRLRTEVILEDLGTRKERPWLDFGNGKAITARQVARLLEPFGVRPDKWKSQSGTERGYQAMACADAWSRYLPADTGTAFSPPAIHQAGSEVLVRHYGVPIHLPPSPTVADGGGTVAAPGGAVSAVQPDEWRQVADGAPVVKGEVLS